MPNHTKAPPAEHRRQPYRRPQSSMRERAAAIYACVSPEVREKLTGKRKADLRRARAAEGSASALERVFEDVAEFCAADDGGVFAEAAILGIREVMDSTRSVQASLPFDARHVLLEARRLDAMENVVDAETEQAGLDCPRERRRLRNAQALEVAGKLRSMAWLSREASQ